MAWIADSQIAKKAHSLDSSSQKIFLAPETAEYRHFPGTVFPSSYPKSLFRGFSVSDVKFCDALA